MSQPQSSQVGGHFRAIVRPRYERSGLAIRRVSAGVASGLVSRRDGARSRRAPRGIDGAVESSHSGTADFRKNNKVVVNLDPDAATITIKLSAAEQTAPDVPKRSGVQPAGWIGASRLEHDLAPRRRRRRDPGTHHRHFGADVNRCRGDASQEPPCVSHDPTKRPVFTHGITTSTTSAAPHHGPGSALHFPGRNCSSRKPGPRRHCPARPARTWTPFAEREVRVQILPRLPAGG